MARILAIDDDVRQLSAIRRILRRSAFQVDTFSNPRNGLRAAMRNSPDLILLDVSMPTLSGHEFLRRLRKLTRRKFMRANPGAGGGALMDPPVIFLTALAAPAQRVTGLDAGAVDYITKPVAPDELRARIRTHLRLAARARQSLAEERIERMHMETAMQGMLEDLRACQGWLGDLGQVIELADHVRRPALRTDLLERAQRNIRGALVALTHTLDQPSGQRKVPS